MQKHFLSTSNLYEPQKERVLEKIHTFFGCGNQETLGVAVEELEDKLAQYHCSKYCVAYSTGFWALVSTVINKIEEGKTEVLLPSLTYRRLADVVHWAGGTPTFVDIKKGDLSISPLAVQKHISKNTGLILAVHPIVNCCDVEKLIEVAEEHQTPIVFDAVESVHETFMGKRVGSFGVGEVFSLHASKLLNGLEGGYVCTNDSSLAYRLRNFREKGQSLEYQGVHLDSRLNDIHAIFALASLEEIDSNIKHNKKIYMRYKKNLAKNNKIRVLEFDESEQTSYKNVVVELLDDCLVIRDTLISKLNSCGILCRAHYYPPLHFKEFDYQVEITDMSNTNYAATRFLNLPCGHRVTTDDVDFVCTTLQECIEK